MLTIFANSPEVLNPRLTVKSQSISKKKSFDVIRYVKVITALKVSKYGISSGPYFPVFRLRTQSEYRKIRTRKNSVFGNFSRSASKYHRYTGVHNNTWNSQYLFVCFGYSTKICRCNALFISKPRQNFSSQWFCALDPHRARNLPRSGYWISSWRQWLFQTYL